MVALVHLILSKQKGNGHKLLVEFQDWVKKNRIDITSFSAVIKEGNNDSIALFKRHKYSTPETEASKEGNFRYYCDFKKKGE